MNKKVQRRVIAKAMEYKNINTTCWRGHKNGIEVRIPDFPEDLNAMYEAEECFGWEEKNEYIEELKRVVRDADCEVYRATAAQRAEAFLKTIGKWE